MLPSVVLISVFFEYRGECYAVNRMFALLHHKISHQIHSVGALI